MEFKVLVRNVQTDKEEEQVIYCEGMEHVFDHIDYPYLFLKFL